MIILNVNILSFYLDFSIFNKDNTSFIIVIKYISNHKNFYY